MLGHTSLAVQVFEKTSCLVHSHNDQLYEKMEKRMRVVTLRLATHLTAFVTLLLPLQGPAIIVKGDCTEESKTGHHGVDSSPC